jgi:hypothetical protein
MNSEGRAADHSDRSVREIERLKEELRSSAELVEARASGELKDEAVKKDAGIERLEAEPRTADISKQLELKEAIGAVEKERDDPKRGLDSEDAEQKLLEASLRERFETQIKDRDYAIERLKDMKVKLSTKMIGEALEQHC